MIRMQKRLVLPNPTTSSLEKPESMGFYLTQLNGSIQNMNEKILNTFTANMKNGTLVLDDGANWRITVVLQQGRVSDITIVASSGAAATFTAI